MKRLPLLLAALLLLGLGACTGPVSPSPAPTATAAPATPAPTAAPATPDPTAAPAPSPAPTAAPDPAPEADATLTAGGVDYPARRFAGDLTGSGGVPFSCLLPTEAVTAAYEHNAWVFRSVGEPEAFLELSFITGGDVESLLPGFLDGYLDFNEIEFSEASALGRLRGEVGRVSAAGGEERAEAWLLDVSGGTVAAVLVCPPEASGEEALLRAMLNTFALG